MTLLASSYLLLGFLQDFVYVFVVASVACWSGTGTVRKKREKIKEPLARKDVTIRRTSDVYVRLSAPGVRSDVSFWRSHVQMTSATFLGFPISSPLLEFIV